MFQTAVNHFKIADFGITIVFQSGNNSMDLLPSFSCFRVEPGQTSEDILAVTVDDALQPVPSAERELIRDIETGNGIIKVDKIKEGGYQFIIRDIHGRDCCLLISDSHFSNVHCALNGSFNMRSYGLNSAMMLSFAFASASRQTLLIHASTVVQGNYGYAFLAKSGTGKSTQVAMWLNYLPGCELLNDDNPIVRVIDGKTYLFGSPWSGKTPCYRNRKVLAGAFVKIMRAKSNSVERDDTLEAWGTLLASVSSMKWDKGIYEMTCNTIKLLIETTDVYTLHCLPDKESAVICNKAIKKK